MTSTTINKRNNKALLETHHNLLGSLVATSKRVSQLITYKQL